MSEPTNTELYAAGWTQLAGPFSESEEHMMPKFLEDAAACNKETMIRPMGYPTGGFGKEALVVWQRSKLSAAALAA